MAFHGILQCYKNPERWFGGVICTDGRGSPRAAQYAGMTDNQMAALRRREQEKAAIIGEYGVIVQLGYTSEAIKDSRDPRLRNDLIAILKASQPSVVYTHNPADKHETHVAVALTTIRAIRDLPRSERPAAVYGCEVWRNLDWLADEDKVVFDVSGRDNLAAALLRVYKSQIAGGKRYDLATLGRRRANATYFYSHGIDAAAALWFALDLTPLVLDETLDVVHFILNQVEKFKHDVETVIRKHLG